MPALLVYERQREITDTLADLLISAVTFGGALRSEFTKLRSVRPTYWTGGDCGGAWDRPAVQGRLSA